MMIQRAHAAQPPLSPPHHTSTPPRPKKTAHTSRQHSRNSPSAFFMMLALWMALILARLLSTAYWNAYSATRVDAVRVITYLCFLFFFGVCVFGDGGGGVCLLACVLKW